MHLAMHARNHLKNHWARTTGLEPRGTPIDGIRMNSSIHSAVPMQPQEGSHLATLFIKSRLLCSRRLISFSRSMMRPACSKRSVCTFGIRLPC
jgi:hypothetical protein